MTVLTIAQTCAGRLQLPSPVTFIGSTNNNMMFLLQMIYRTIFEIRDSFCWPELQKQYVFLTVAGLDAIRLPADYNSTLTETLWNKDQHWPLLGPLTPSEWQSYKSGWIATIPQSQYRVKGWDNNQFFINPTPSSTEACVFEYISKSAFRPKTWVATTAYTTAAPYVSYNGQILRCTTNGTSSTTQPPEFGRDGTVFWKSVPTWVNSISYYVDQYIFANSNVYKCTVAGKGSAVAPSHSSGTATNGTCTFEFYSTPASWVAGTSYEAEITVVNATSDCFICVIDGISGDYSPKFRSVLLDNNTLLGQTTDTITDGTVIWTMYYNPYETFAADTDEVILDYQNIIDGTVWRFKQERGLPYQDLKQDAEDQLEIARSNLSGSDVLSVNRRRLLPPMIGYWSMPCGNYGI